MVDSFNQQNVSDTKEYKTDHDLFCIRLQLKKALLGPKRFAD